MKLFVLVALTSCLLPLTPSRLSADAEVDTGSFLKLSARGLHEEADPGNDQQCFSMGRMTIVYASGEAELPMLGFRITDPRGRDIGYDPRTKRGWQEMPLAQAYVDCDENEDTAELRHCKGHIEICGPISGTYRIELLPSRGGKYAISVSATSQRRRNGASYVVTTSRADWESAIREREPAVLLLRYSREAGTQIKLTGSDQHVAGR